MIFTGQVKFFTGQKNQSQVFWTILSTMRHSLTRFQRAKKKTAPEKKTAFLLTYSFFHEKLQILNFPG